MLFARFVRACVRLWDRLWSREMRIGEGWQQDRHPCFCFVPFCLRNLSASHLWPWCRGHHKSRKVVSSHSCTSVRPFHLCFAASRFFPASMVHSKEVLAWCHLLLCTLMRPFSLWLSLEVMIEKLFTRTWFLLSRSVAILFLTLPCRLWWEIRALPSTISMIRWGKIRRPKHLLMLASACKTPHVSTLPRSSWMSFGAAQSCMRASHWNSGSSYGIVKQRYARAWKVYLHTYSKFMDHVHANMQQMPFAEYFYTK